MMHRDFGVIRGIPAPSVSKGTVEMVLGELHKRRTRPQDTLGPRPHLERRPIVASVEAGLELPYPIPTGSDGEARIRLRRATLTFSPRWRFCWRCCRQRYLPTKTCMTSLSSAWPTSVLSLAITT